MKNSLKKVCSSLIIVSLSISAAFIPGIFSKKAFAGEISQHIGEIEVNPGKEVFFPYTCSVNGDSGTFMVDTEQGSSSFLMKLYDSSKYLLSKKDATGSGNITFSTSSSSNYYFSVENNAGTAETFEGYVKVKGSSFTGLQCTSDAKLLKVLSTLLTFIVGGNILINS